MVRARRGPRMVALVGVAVALAIAAAACGASSATPQKIYITPSPGTVTPLPPGVTPEPTSTPPTITTFLVESTALDSRWKVTFKKPVVGGIGDEIAAQMNNAIGDKVNAFISAFTDSNLPEVAAGAGPSTLEGDYSIAADTSSMISLRFTVLTFVSGAAHPAGQPGSITFVVTSGTPVALSELFADQAKALSTVTSECQASLTKTLGADLTWDGKASSLDFFAKAWVITPNGLEFTFNQGDLASQAAGMPSATVAWSALKPALKAGGAASDFAG